jgi:hypothetical protein
MESVSKQRIDALLSQAVQSSAANMDLFKEDLTCDFNEHSMIKHLQKIQSMDGNSGSSRSDSLAGVGSVSTTISTSRLGSDGKDEKRGKEEKAKGIEMFQFDYKVVRDRLFRFVGFLFFLSLFTPIPGCLACEPCDLQTEHQRVSTNISPAFLCSAC